MPPFRIVVIRSLQVVFCAFFGLAGSRAFAQNPSPSQTTSPDGNRYGSPLPVNDPFPDANYGADHGGSSLNIVYPYLSQFGYGDHSRGYLQYYVAPFYPRGSEGVFGMDIFLEQQDSSGNWDVISSQYQYVGTPNPGPSASYNFVWYYNPNQFPPNTNFRVFVYVYIYNQGGGSQGDWPIYSTSNVVNTGAANDAPRISWTAASGAINPSQVQSGQTYIVSADGQDDNGNLVAVSINKDGQPFAYAGGGTGYSGNSQNPTSDSSGTHTFSAWATDSYGATSPTITWQVQVVGKSNQAPVGSSNVSFPYYSQNFTPPYYGGSGSGAWQFCVLGYTNWDAGNSSYAGTNLGPSPGNSPGADWVPSWTPPGPGTYQFDIAKDGDANYNASGAVGPYTLTVTPANPVGSFDGVTPGSVSQGQAISGSGWAADAQLGSPLSTVQILVDGGAHGSFGASLSGSRPDVQAANLSWGHWSPHDLTNSGWSFSFNTGGLAAGSHTFTAVAYDYSYGVSATIGSQSFTVAAPLGQSVSLSPTSATIYAGTTVVFSASGGVNGYVWGGAASGGGGSQSVTFSSPGFYSVTVYSPAGSGYAQSNTASASIAVAARPSASLTATPATLQVGQSSTIHATYSTDSAHGDALTNSVVNVVNPQGQETQFSGYGGNPITATFSPSAAGTYTFKAYASTTLTPNWTVYATASVTVSSSPPTASGGVSPNPISYGQNATVTAAGSSAGGILDALTVQQEAPGGNWSAWQNWTFGPTSAQNEAAGVSGLTPGSWNYRVMATDSTGATSGWQAFALTVNKATPSVSNWGNRSLAAGYAVQASDLAASFSNPYSGSATAPTAADVSYANVSNGTGLAAGTVLYPGSYDMRASFSGDSNYNPASADATWTVTADPQTVSLAPTGGTIPAGQQIAFTASGGNNGYFWGGSASGSGVSQTVSFPTPGTFVVTVYSPAGGLYAASNMASATITVNPDSQTVSISPATASVTVGGSIAFTAGGGMNGYLWGGAAAGSGGSQLVTFSNTGTFTVTVYSPAGGIYAQSNVASATVTVTAASQAVVLTPVAPVIYAGTAVTFSASGGMNGYSWGGAAAGSGPTETVTFGSQGTYLVTVYSPSGGNFAQSNVASSTVTVNPLPPPASAEVIVTPQGGDVTVENSKNKHNSQILVPGP